MKDTIIQANEASGHTTQEKLAKTMQTQSHADIKQSVVKQINSNKS